MKNNLLAQIIYRTAFLTAAIFGLLISIGIWDIGNGFDPNTNFNLFFFTDFFNWALVMAILSTVFALTDNIKSVKSGLTHAYAERFPILKFCTMSSMIFCLILGVFFVNRVGSNYLTQNAQTELGSIFPGIATAGFWTDLSVLLPRLILPISFIIGFVLFEERLKSRPIYSTIGILPPTVFYFFDFFLGLIFTGAYGGEQNLLDAGLYADIYPYFFSDSAFTYDHWSWILIWPTIFGVSLMIINNIVYYITRTVKNENGKCKIYRKMKVEEDKMRDCIHFIKLKTDAKKNNSDK